MNVDSPGFNYRNERWMDDAACTGHDVNKWYWDGNTSIDDKREARAICDSCPVATQCLEYALRTDDRNGIWGGLHPTQRDDLRRGIKRTPKRPTIDPRDIVRKPRTECVHGHSYTEENTHVDKRGWRQCRTCIAAKQDRRREKNRKARDDAA